ncbi:CPBP family intramembrane glutamic endopeptidase [Caulobacter sp. 17J80-11]|uniref:CPBP family intramembrane glutamic endopeptidase n=1 Tax=Caulobacter sp. 17J80-11 TaxID=2763502 RepID=UPI00165367FD|nr:CPBP family intramembrane glutamic endopeptidase [Caulobacter sp. 17J80-11]MBC6982162.1 CPBP family intramembrane metalloprotease [Caulobacter sp. 17J80-11]
MSEPRKRSFLATLPRIGLVRLIGLGFPLLLGLGFTLAFHFEFAAKQLAPALDFAATAGVTLGLAVLYALLVRAFEGRWPKELALRPAPGWLAAGLLIGFLLFSAVYAVFAAMGVASWQGFNGFGAVAPALLLAIVAAVGEELLFRGVLFRLLEESFGTLVALVLSAAIFGLMHAGNPGATPLSTVAVALEAGVMLAAAYAWTRSLWLPIGIHLAWNFTQGGIYGAAVSGGKSQGVFDVALAPDASELITGGAFGPEASLVALTICLAAGLVFVVAAIRAGQWRKARFRLVLDRG